MNGSMMLADLVDFNLEQNPAYPAFVYSEAPGALTEMSFLAFGLAAHRAGDAIRPSRTGAEGEVVALSQHRYIVVSDPRPWNA